MNSYKKAIYVGILGFCVNIFVFIMKLFIGLMTKSYAMIGDALNSGADILNSAIILLGSGISAKKANEKYPLGYGKAEYVFSLFTSIIMITISIFIFKSSFFSFFDGEHMEFSYYIIVVCVINILLKLIMFLYTRKLAKKYNNMLIEVGSQDHRNDMFLTISTLISGIFGYYQIWVVDGIVGICIGLWIFFVGMKLLLSSSSILMDCDDCGALKQDVKNTVKKISDAVNVCSIISIHSVGGAEVRLVLALDSGMNIYEYSILRKRIIRELSEDTRIGRVILQIISK